MSTRFFIPRMDLAKSDTLVTSFADKCVAGLDYNLDSSEIALINNSELRCAHQ
jgi:hypothetical protein